MTWHDLAAPDALNFHEISCNRNISKKQTLKATSRQSGMAKTFLSKSVVFSFIVVL